MKRLFSALVALSALSLTVAHAEDRTGWPRSFKVVTASQGGTYFVYGSGWANLVGETLGISGGAEVTGGPTQNAALIQTGDAEFGQVTMGPAFDAWNGESELAPGLPHDKLRAMFPMYQTSFAFIALKNSGIDSVQKLQGRNYGVGPAGGTASTYLPRFLEALGVRGNPRFGGASDQTGQLQDGLLDAFGFAAGHPIPAFNQLEAQMDVNIFAFSQAEAELLAAQFPVVVEPIPAQFYKSLTGSGVSVSMWNFAVANADLPESFVYAVTKIVMENNDRMVNIHRAAVETLPENALKNTFLPFHPGAARWYVENGIDLPAHLLP